MGKPSRSQRRTHRSKHKPSTGGTPGPHVPTLQVWTVHAGGGLTLSARRRADVVREARRYKDTARQQPVRELVHRNAA